MIKVTEEMRAGGYAALGLPDIAAFEIKDKIEKTATAWLAQDPLFLDTETTGLDDDAEIVEIAILDAEGNILLQELCRPSKPMAPEAAAVNKIDPAELDDAQPWPSIAGQVASLLAGRLVICHNADYDARLIRQTCRIHNTPAPAPAEWGCTLQLLWPLNGERRPRLTRAMELAGAEYPAEGSAHRAAYDAECCRRIVLALGAEDLDIDRGCPHKSWTYYSSHDDFGGGLPVWICDECGETKGAENNEAAE